jgi:hypothetical protein
LARDSGELEKDSWFSSKIAEVFGSALMVYNYSGEFGNI